MNAITNFDKQNLRLVRIALENALKAVSSEFNIALSIGSIGYDIDGGKFTTRLTALTRSNHPSIQPLPLTGQIGTIGINTKFKVRTCDFTIIKEYKNRPKYKFVAENQNGTRYKFTEASIRSHIINGI